jgi:hypothetical protein
VWPPLHHATVVEGRANPAHGAIDRDRHSWPRERPPAWLPARVFVVLRSPTRHDPIAVERAADLAVGCDRYDRVEAVDELARTALAAGATSAMPPIDMGFMYSRSFYDLDGHHWEPVWMDPNAVPKPS